ncbi:hypothetical protein I3F58_12685 [Streptomyces sp. MUM 203J]|nr:hypothetical protein [Streptomyces sp. MUM 203J]
MEGGGWFEFTLAVILALAAVGTAWAGFQSQKWGGVQANSFAAASAARTESTRQSTEAGQFLTIDVIMFTQWLTALNEEILADPSKRPEGEYVPDPDSVSGLLFTRFRSEFKPAVNAWLKTRPLTDPDAPSTPFSMPEYQLATLAEAVKELKEAERLSAKARQSNQRSDNYVLTAVLFALVLFFASVAGRAHARRPRVLLFGLTVLTLTGAVVLLVLYPVQL